MADVNETMIQGTKVVSGDVVSFNTPREVNIRSLKVYFSPKQAGEGTPSPDNVRSISGWTGVEIEHCGKNLWGGEYGADLIKASKSSQVVKGIDDVGPYIKMNYMSGAQKYYATDVPFKENTQYTLIVKYVKGEHTNLNIRFFYTDGSNQVLNASNLNTVEVKAFTSAAGKTLKGLGDLTRTGGTKIYYDTFGLFEGVLTVNDYEPYKTKISLPPTLQHVEYLESTGTQYIVTNYIPPLSDELVIDWEYMFTKSQVGDSMLWGYANGSGGNVPRAQCEVYNGTSWYVSNGKYASRGVLKNVGNALNVKYSGVIDKNGLVINGQTGSITNTYSDGSARELYIFSWKSTQGGVQYINHGARLYSLKFTDDNVISANFIPCYRKSDKVAGMYDTVSNTFYTNSGTGEFITGPEVNPHSIDWTSDAGTVYGGYVDLVSGELVETIAMIDLKDYPFAQYSKTNHCWGRYSLSGMKYGKDVGSDLICDAYNALTPMSILSGGEDLAIWPYNTTQARLIIRNDAYIQEDGTYDINALNESLSGVMVTYPLATPITYQLSPATLTSLVQTNTFWSNADRVEVEYEFVNKFNAVVSRKNIFSGTPRTESLSGNILSFNTDMAVDLKECKVYFKPKQDLHGYSKPWIGGMGKNLLDVSQRKDGYYIDAGGNENANSQFGYTTAYTPVNSNTTYTLSGNIGNHASAYGAIYCYNENKEFIDRLGGFKTDELPHTFTTPENTAYVNIQYALLNNAPENVQLESGSSATSYEPYSNICPIEGWDGINIGRNIGQDFYVYDVRNSNSGSIVTKIDEHSFSLSTSRKITYPASRQDSTSLDLTIGKHYFIDFDIDITKLADEHTCSFGFRNTSNTFQADTCVVIKQSGHYGFDFVYDSDTRLHYLSLCETSGQVVNFDATVSNLHIYEATSIVIEFPKTIYGGYVDLVKGEVVETWTNRLLTSPNNFSVASSGGITYTWCTIKAIIQEKLLKTSAYGDSNGMFNIGLWRLNVDSNDLKSNSRAGILSVTATNGTLQIVESQRGFPDCDLTTADGRNQMINQVVERYGGFQIVAKLASNGYHTYPITAQNISTLRGANTIYSNSNDVTEITYFKHGDDAYTHIPVSNALSSNDNFILVTDDGYVIGDSNDYIVY